jgi:glyoxylase-like metal-dependent hydrolase (beta-lactamase superfamily II)
MTCGTQFAESASPPPHCPICEDERQYIGPNGQQWTTLAGLQQKHKNLIKPQETNLTGIGSDPRFAIGQRALLLQTPAGNLLWDCITLIDGETIAAVQALGGIAAIAISHPHYYSCMVEWSKAFDAPIYLHAADREHVMRPDPNIRFWEGETLPLLDNLTLIRCGGHFEGGTVAHWPQGAEGRGVLLTGDILQVVQDRRYVSFMRSYPNLIPLPASAIRRIVAAVEPYRFDRLYGAWWDTLVAANAKAGVHYSAERYIKAISE